MLPTLELLIVFLRHQAKSGMQKLKKPKRAWVSNVDIGSFNKSEAQISSCSRFVLHNSSNKIFILIYKKKQPGDKGDQISSPFVYQAQESRFWFPCQGSDRIFDFFPWVSLIFPQKNHMNPWSSWKILIFFTLLKHTDMNKLRTTSKS